MSDKNNNARVTPEDVLVNAVVRVRAEAEEEFKNLCGVYADFCKEKLPEILCVKEGEESDEIRPNEPMTLYKVSVLCKFFRTGRSWISHTNASNDWRFLYYWWSVARATFTTDGGLAYMREIVRKGRQEIVSAAQKIDKKLSNSSDTDDVYGMFRAIDDIELMLQILGEEDADWVYAMSAYVEQIFDRHMEKFVPAPIRGRIFLYDLSFIDIHSPYLAWHKLSLRKYHKVLNRVGFEKAIQEQVKDNLLP